MRERYTRYPRSILWLVPGGEVYLGGGEGAAGPVETAEVEPFYLSKIPVTNEQYEAFDPGFERSTASQGDHDTAVGVRCEEAEEYCRWYAEVARKPIRLPGETEWEHACRAGTAGRVFFPEDEADLYLWDAGNSGGRVRSPEKKKANGFGLFGMLGGVWEWTAGAEEDSRVLRGGSFLVDRGTITCSLRRLTRPGERPADAGFRIAKSLR